MGSCGANKREFEDQSAIKGKLRPNWDKTKLVSHFGRVKKKREEEERRREKVEEGEKKGKGMETMNFYGFVWKLWFCMELVWIVRVLYGLKWFCMDFYGWL